MMRMGIGCLLVGAVVGFLGIKEMRLKAGSSGTPQEITLTELIDKGHGQNNFLILKDFIYGDNFLFKPLSKNSPHAWDSAWTPIFPPAKPGQPPGDPARFQAIIFWPDVRSETQYKELTQQPTLKGMVINEV